MAMLGKVPAVIMHAAEVVAVAAIISVAFISVAPRFESAIRKSVDRIAGRVRAASMLGQIVTQFFIGMQAFHSMRRLCVFSLLTLASWLSDAVAAVLVGYSLNLKLDFLLALLLLAALGLSSGLPSTPGYLGLYQFVTVSVLTPFGFSNSQALAYILAFQATIYTVVTFWGGIGFWKMRRALSSARQKSFSTKDRLITID